MPGPAISVDLHAVAGTASLLGKSANRKQVCRWLSETLQAAGFASDAGYELSVRVVDEPESRALNAEYRQRDKPTNVLSFPFDGYELLPADVRRPLGDLVICAKVVQREAEEQGKKVSSHFAHMVVHGTLHLLGFDHETSEQAASMESLEQRILQVFGIDDPYA